MTIFVKITNKEIYERLTIIEDKIDMIHGKLKINRWIASTALSLALLALAASIS